MSGSGTFMSSIFSEGESENECEMYNGMQATSSAGSNNPHTSARSDENSDASKFAEKIRVLLDDQDDFQKFTRIVRAFKKKEMLESDAIVQLANIIRQKFDDVILGLNAHLSDGYEIVKVSNNWNRHGYRCQVFYRTPECEDLIPLLASDMRMKNIVAKLDEAKSLLRMRNQSQSNGRENNAKHHHRDESTICANVVTPGNSTRTKSVGGGLAQYRERRSREAFDRRVIQLKGYKKKHGHLKVRSSDDPGLYSYCSNLRKSMENNSLSDERIKILRGIGFGLNQEVNSSSTSSSSDLGRGNEGTTLVDRHGAASRKDPESSSSDEGSGSKRQTSHAKAVLEARTKYPKGRSMETFRKRLEDLKAFKKKYGHLNVTCKEDLSLYKYCWTLRKSFRQPGYPGSKPLNEEQVRMLHDIGFDFHNKTVQSSSLSWSSPIVENSGDKKVAAKEILEAKIKYPKGHSMETFKKRLEDLKAFKKKHGHLHVTRKIDQSLYLHCWKMRRSFRQPRSPWIKPLNEEQVRMLHDIGFDLSNEKMKSTSSASSVVLHGGDKEVTAKFSAGRKCSKATSPSVEGSGSKQKATISEARTKHGERLSMKVFKKRLKDLKAFKKKYGHLHVTCKIDLSLYQYCGRLRRSFSQPGSPHCIPLSEDQIRLLHDIGFDFHDETMESSSSLSSSPIIDNSGDKNIVATASPVPDIGFELSEDNMESSLLSSSHVDNSGGRKVLVKCSASKKRSKKAFYRRVEQLKSYKDKHGHVNVTAKDDKSLYVTCQNIRKSVTHPGTSRRTPLDEDQIQILRDIGFDFHKHPKTSSSSSILGGSGVVRRKGGLGGAVALRRSNRKNDQLSEVIELKDSSDRRCVATFNRRVEQLRDYKKKYGHINFTREDNSSLYQYCCSLRNAMTNNTLADDKVQVLKEIGFEFNEETHKLNIARQMFHRWVEQLQVYKQKHGHLNVKWAQDRKLYMYCSKLRRLISAHVLTKVQLQILKDIGFEFDIPIHLSSSIDVESNHEGEHGHWDHKSLSSMAVEPKEITHRPRRTSSKTTSGQSTGVSEGDVYHDYGLSSTLNLSHHVGGFEVGLDISDSDDDDEIDCKRSKRWNEVFRKRVEQLRAYQKKHGHINFTWKEDISLSQYCKRLRESMANHTLAENKVQMLREIGFEFNQEIHNMNVLKRTFNQRIEQLRKYKKKYGHVNVTNNDDRSLYMYCYKLRKAMAVSNSTNNSSKKSTLSKEQVQTLKDIGFEFDIEIQSSSSSRQSKTRDEKTKNWKGKKSQKKRLLNDEPDCKLQADNGKDGLDDFFQGMKVDFDTPAENKADNHAKWRKNKRQRVQRGVSSSQDGKSTAEIALNSVSALGKSSYGKQHVDTDSKLRSTYGSNNGNDRNGRLGSKNSSNRRLLRKNIPRGAMHNIPLADGLVDPHENEYFSSESEFDDDYVLVDTDDDRDFTPTNNPDSGKDENIELNNKEDEEKESDSSSQIDDLDLDESHFSDAKKHLQQQQQEEEQTESIHQDCGEAKSAKNFDFGRNGESNSSFPKQNNMRDQIIVLSSDESCESDDDNVKMPAFPQVDNEAGLVNTDEYEYSSSETRIEKSKTRASPQRSQGEKLGDSPRIEVRRIAIGSKIADGPCSMTYRSGTKSQHIIIKYVNDVGEEETHQIDVNEIKEIKYFSPLDDNDKNLESENDESMQQNSNSVNEEERNKCCYIVVRATPTVGNGLLQCSHVYLSDKDFYKYFEDNEDKDNGCNGRKSRRKCKNRNKQYVVVEIRNRKDFDFIFDVMREQYQLIAAMIKREGGKLNPSNKDEYISALIHNDARVVSHTRETTRSEESGSNVNTDNRKIPTSSNADYYDETVDFLEDASFKNQFCWDTEAEDFLEDASFKNQLCWDTESRAYQMKDDSPQKRTSFPHFTRNANQDNECQKGSNQVKLSPYRVETASRSGEQMVSFNDTEKTKTSNGNKGEETIEVNENGQTQPPTAGDFVRVLYMQTGMFSDITHELWTIAEVLEVTKVYASGGQKYKIRINYTDVGEYSMDYPHEDVERIIARADDSSVYETVEGSQVGSFACDKNPSALMIGDHVECLHQNGTQKGIWFSGRVASTSDDGKRVDIAYFDGEYEKNIPVGKGVICLISRGMQEAHKWLVGAEYVDDGRCKKKSKVVRVYSQHRKECNSSTSSRTYMDGMDNLYCTVKMPDGTEKEFPYIEVVKLLFTWKLKNTPDIKKWSDAESSPVEIGKEPGSGLFNKCISIADILFQDRIKELKLYKAEHGHTNVKEGENQSLYSWCQLIKASLQEYSEGKRPKKLSLTEDRLRQLEAIGFIHKNAPHVQRELPHGGVTFV